MATFRSVADKLYRSAFWLLLVPPVLIVPAVFVIAVHDSYVVGNDLDCYDREIAQARAKDHEFEAHDKGLQPPNSEFDPAAYLAKKKGFVWDDELASDWRSGSILLMTREVEATCHVALSAGQSAIVYSTRTWTPWDGWAAGTRGNERWASTFAWLLAFVPVGLLSGLNRWVRWLLK